MIALLLRIISVIGFNSLFYTIHALIIALFSLTNHSFIFISNLCRKKVTKTQSNSGKNINVLINYNKKINRTSHVANSVYSNYSGDKRISLQQKMISTHNNV